MQRRTCNAYNKLTYNIHISGLSESLIPQILKTFCHSSVVYHYIHETGYIYPYIRMRMYKAPSIG